ncbi:MAG: SUMF1/EgtB/PvdO family nonheme iron enzyme, partial [Methyloligellaceae bacterium]
MSVMETASEQAEFGDAVVEGSQQANLVKTRHFSLQLVDPLSAEDQVVQAMDDASPAKWHLAHTTWFFEDLILKPYLDDYQVFDACYSYCFNSYYETVGPRHPRPKRGLLTRPSVEEVHAYRSHVDDALDRLFATYASELPNEIAALITLGINHEQQHQELLLTDILSLFAASPLRPAYQDAQSSQTTATAPDMQWIGFDGGIFEVGNDGTGFAYDNEAPRHEALIRPFRLANRPVSNGEWLAFMEDGGYRTSTLWLSDGWATVNDNDWQAPLYWENRDGEWLQMSLQGLLP